MDRKQKIDFILNGFSGKGIDIDMWITQFTDPYNEEWRAACLDMVDWHYRTTGKKDLDSVFAQRLKRWTEPRRLAT